MSTPDRDEIRIRWSEPQPPRGPRPHARVAEWIDAAVRGKDWRLRAPLLPILVWFFWRHLGDFDFQGIYDGLNLALHEAGHALFMWFGNEFLMIAGGTLLELACPLFAGIVFWRQRDAFGVTVALFWLGTVFLDIAPYAADATRQELPLVSLGDGPIGHDWFEMLFRLGLLGQDQAIGRGFYVAGLVTLALSIAAGCWVLWRMREVNRSGPGGPRYGSTDEDERLRRFVDEGGETTTPRPT